MGKNKASIEVANEGIQLYPNDWVQIHPFIEYKNKIKIKEMHYIKGLALQSSKDLKKSINSLKQASTLAKNEQV